MTTVCFILTCYLTKNGDSFSINNRSGVITRGKLFLRQNHSPFQISVQLFHNRWALYIAKSVPSFPGWSFWKTCHNKSSLMFDIEQKATWYFIIVNKSQVQIQENLPPSSSLPSEDGRLFEAVPSLDGTRWNYWIKHKQSQKYLTFNSNREIILIKHKEYARKYPLKEALFCNQQTFFSKNSKSIVLALNTNNIYVTYLSLFVSLFVYVIY